MRMGNTRLVTALLAFLVLAWTSSGESARQERLAILTPVASSEAPLSRGGDIALATEAAACVIESYESRIHCIPQDGGIPAVFGRRGQGPGEFPSEPSRIVRGPDATVGVVAVERRRMSVFEPSGAWVFDVRLPSRLQASAPFDSVLPSEDIQRIPEGFAHRHLDVDVRTGDILWERVFPKAMAAEARCTEPPLPEGFAHPEGLGDALRISSGGMIFRLCRGQMLFLADRDDDLGTVIRPPLYAEEYPTEKDVERYLEDCGPPSPMVLRPPCELEEFRGTPKRYGLHYWVDDQDRLWVLTERDREEFSYLDIYVGPEFAGSVRVRQRAVSFDVFGSTLAVLVDRPVGPDDADGYPDRGIDWYDISGLEFGSASSP